MHWGASVKNRDDKQKDIASLRQDLSAARNVFYGGSAFFFAIFLGLTAHSHYYMATTSTDAAKLTSSVARGKHVWEKHSCINCHTLLGEGASGRRKGHSEGLDAGPAVRGDWPAANAAVQPHRSGAQRSRRLPGMDQQHQAPELASEQGRLIVLYLHSFKTESR